MMETRNEMRDKLLVALDNAVEDTFVSGLINPDEIDNIMVFVDKLADFRLSGLLTSRGMEYITEAMYVKYPNNPEAGDTYQDSVFDFICLLNANIDMMGVQFNTKKTLLKSASSILINNVLDNDALKMLYEPHKNVSSDSSETIHFIFNIYVLRLYVNFVKQKLISKATLNKNTHKKDDNE